MNTTDTEISARRAKIDQLHNGLKGMLLRLGPAGSQAIEDAIIGAMKLLPEDKQTEDEEMECYILSLAAYGLNQIALQMLDDVNKEQA